MQSFAHFALKTMKDTHRGLSGLQGDRSFLDNLDLHLDAAIDWLMRSIEVCGGRASSKGYRIMSGWMPPYPETTGYIIPTLLTIARGRNDQHYARTAWKLGRWLAEIQQANGGFHALEMGRGGAPDVFDTGMILLGFNALLCGGNDRDAEILASSERAAAFLLASMDDDGCYRRNVHYDMVHAYNVRASWALLAFGHLTGKEAYCAAALRNISWTCDRQSQNGFFPDNGFKPGANANTHGIAYVLRGLLQAYSLTEDHTHLDAVIRPADALVALYGKNGWIAGELGPDWEYLASHVCLTGYAQLAIILLRLFRLTSKPVYRTTAFSLINDVARSQQVNRPNSPAYGAIAGSFPIYGRYAPFQYPNWATKFFIDALLECQFIQSGKPIPSRLQRYAG